MGNTSEDQELNTLCGLKCDQIIASLFIVEFVMCYIYIVYTSLLLIEKVFIWIGMGTSPILKLHVCQCLATKSCYTISS